MCDWGDTVELQVPICAADSHTGEARMALKPIDSCIADIVRALNAGGVPTRSCCCGHGQYQGSIVLQDGRELVIGKETHRYPDSRAAMLDKLGIKTLADLMPLLR